METGGLVRDWRPGRPVDLAATLSPHRRGGTDPTWAREAGGALWRAARTPEGPGSVRLSLRPADATVEIRTYGPGAAWLVDAVPRWLGADDDPSGFVPDHPVLRDTLAARPGWRIGATSLVMEALVPAVLEQKVTSTEAWQGWATLLRWYGEHAPGPCPPRLRVPPDAETWRRIPSWDWHRAGVGPQRSQTVVRATRVAVRLEECLEMPYAERAARLRTVQGVGSWTAAEVLQRACGDPDAVSVGDFHLPRLVVWALTGEVSDSDDDMLACLEPYRGHRYRVTKLLEMSGVKSPRFGPRLAPRDFRAM